MTASLMQARHEGGDDRVGEALSSVIDGEVELDECSRILDRLCSDPQLRRRWAELHLVADALRSSEVGELHMNGFAERVTAALAEEPTVLAPAALTWRRYPRVLLPGVAAAAAVALLAVGIVPMLQDSGGVRTAAQSTPVARQAAPPVGAGEVARIPELENYLLAHRELAGGMVMPGAAQYLRASTTMRIEAR